MKSRSENSSPRTGGGTFPPQAAAFAGFLLCLAAASSVAAQVPVTPLASGLFDSLLGTLRASNPELIARRAALHAAEARVGAVGWAPPWSLAAEVDDVPNGTDIGGAGVRILFEREFLTSGRGEAARTSARATALGAEAALHATEQRVLAQSSLALSEIVHGAAIAQRLAAEDSLLQAAEVAVQGRFATGEARYVDVLRLRTERLRIRSEQSSALARARVGRATLIGLLGPESGDKFGLLVDSIAVRDPSTVLATQLPAVPDIDSLVAATGAVRLAEAMTARARAGRGVLLAEQRPRVALSVGAQRFAGALNGSSFGPTLGGSLSLPFTASRANRAGRVAADAQVAAAEASRATAIAVVRAAFVAARERYESARSRLDLFEEELLIGAREEREGALAAYRTGDLSLLELIDFERALARAELDRLNARAEAVAALLTLLYLPGDVPEWPELDFAAAPGDHDE